MDNKELESAAPLSAERDTSKLESEVVASGEAEDSEEWEEFDLCYKMVFVVNTSLKMSIGKTAAQVAHGCLGLYRDIEKGSNVEKQEALQTWIEEGQKKIVLCGKSTEQLEELACIADCLKIPWHLVHDAGHTEIAAGSTTVLALFGEEDEVNQVTGSLRLLK